MKEYYIYLNEEQKGPFKIEDLKANGLNKESLVWHDGLENWIKAGEIEDLRSAFPKTPPPIGLYQNTQADIPKPTVLKNQISRNETSSSSQNVKSKGKYYILGALVLAIGITSYFVQVQNRLDEQKLQIQHQQQIEQARSNAEMQAQVEADNQRKADELATLKYELDNAITQLRLSKVKLEEINKFRLLRAPSEKDAQIEAQLIVIRDWENEAARLEKEIAARE